MEGVEFCEYPAWVLSKNVDPIPLYANALTQGYTKSTSKERFGLVWEVPCTTVTGY